jgi:hypothetical protein
LAAAFVHLSRREYRGTIRLLDAAVEKLRHFPEGLLGINAAALAQDAHRAREELVALGPSDFTSWNRTSIPVIHLLQSG